MPQSVEAEVAVLGSILLSPGETLDVCMQMLTSEHFYQRGHKIIYETVQGMFQKAEPIDAVTLTTRLKDQGKLDEVGGAYYISRLSIGLAIAAHVAFYIDVLKEKLILRRFIETSFTTMERAYGPVEDIKEFADHVETEIFKICEGDPRTHDKSLKEISETVIGRLIELRKNPGKLPGISWGFKDLDRLTLGLHPEEMVVIAARPGIGKTSLALNIAERLIFGNPSVPVAIVSLEMSAEQLFLRMVSSAARVNIHELRLGTASEKLIRDFSKEASRLTHAPFYIIDTPQMSVTQVRASARRLKARVGIELLIIDYLQLMVGSGLGRNDNREREVASISNGMKALAKELKIPIIVLSQFNRKGEDRPKEDRKPRISDLRESGAIEQDADMVVLMARDSEPDEHTGMIPESIVANLYVAKNRNGPVGDAQLVFLPKYTRFEDCVPAAMR